MLERIHQFFWEDSRARRLIYVSAAFLGTLFGLVRVLIFHKPEQQVGIEVIVLLVVLIFGSIFLYCLVGEKSHIESVLPVKRRLSPRLRYVGAVACVLLLVAPRISVSAVQAAIVDSRLTSVSSNLDTFDASYYVSPEKRQSQLQAHLRRFESIADVSLRYRIPVNPDVLNKAKASLRHSTVDKPQLSESTRQAAWAAYGKLSELGVAGATQGSHEEPPRSAYPIASTLLLEGKHFQMIGNHSAFSFVGGGSVVIQNSTIVFDGIDFRTEYSFYPALFISPDSSVVVRNSTLENLDQTLDNVTWVNVRFEHSMIRVLQRPFTLVNVSFKDCDLQRLSLTGNVGDELQERIEKANGEPITFAYLPQ